MGTVRQGITGMDPLTLRTRQRPLKVRYRADPSSALVRLRAEGAGWGSPAVQGGDECRGRAGRSARRDRQRWSGRLRGRHAPAGARRLCRVTLLAVATARRLTLRGGRVSAVGQWGARGTLGVDPGAPVGLRSVELSFALDTEAAPEQLDKLMELTERYCVVLQTLRHPPTIDQVARGTG